MRGLLYIAIAVAVIILIQLWQARRKARAREDRQRQASLGTDKGCLREDDVIEMVACPRCGTYFDPTDVNTRPYCSEACQRRGKR